MKSKIGLCLWTLALCAGLAAPCAAEDLGVSADDSFDALQVVRAVQLRGADDQTSAEPHAVVDSRDERQSAGGFLRVDNPCRYVRLCAIDENGEWACHWEWSCMPCSGGCE